MVELVGNADSVGGDGEEGVRVFVSVELYSTSKPFQESEGSSKRW